MKFLKALTQKKLAKAVVCGLVVSGGMVAGIGQAFAAPAEPTAWISGAEFIGTTWWGTAGKEVKVTAEKHTDAREYVSGEICGAEGSDGGKVTIEGGTIKNFVFGGNQKNNIVNICGGTIDEVYGAQGVGNGNTVNIIGQGGELNGLKNNGEKISIRKISGGALFVDPGVAANYLNVTGTDTKVTGKIEMFSHLNFVLPAGVTKGADMLTIIEESDITDLIYVKEIKVTAVNGVQLSKGDTVNLIHKTGSGPLSINAEMGYDPIFNVDTGEVESKHAAKVVISSPLTATSGKVTMEPLDEDKKRNDLVFTALENISINDDTPEGKELADKQKSHVETRANAAALLNEGADFMMDQGMASAKAAAKEGVKEGSRELAPFVAVGAGNMRYKTGSHVDSKSWHAGVGVSKQVGDMMYGIAVEHGKSNYDSYVNAVHGEGDSKATGGTVFAEMKKESGVHYDAAVRAGRVKNDYSCAAIGSSYNESSTYYGMSIGGGKEFAVSDKDAVDVYGRYYWAHTNSSDVIIAGDRLSFDAVNSHRTRVGSRYTHTVNDMSKLYAGLAWQYEFSGKAKATVNGDAAPAPSLKGNSGMLELGWKVEASKNMAIDLNMSGWTGKQRGVMGGVNMQWKF